jgi:hypothetical protein
VTNRAALLHLVGDEFCSCDQEQDSKLFDLFVRHCSLQVGDQMRIIAAFPAI